jgi:hypothetical protein
MALISVESPLGLCYDSAWIVTDFTNRFSADYSTLNQPGTSRETLPSKPFPKPMNQEPRP